MTIDSASPAAASPADPTHGHSTASFGSLVMGSIGVVYGDIGTSPLYALREALVAAGATRRPASTMKQSWASSR